MHASRLAPGFREALEGAGLWSVDALGARALGEPVKDHRSSWVRAVNIDSMDVYVKTYDYPRLADRLRGLGRTTFWSPSRATREWDALAWLRSRGFAAPEPLAAVELRRRGLLRRAVLVTAAHPGHVLDQWLPHQPAATIDAVLGALEAHVEALHAAGFRHRNLDLRNLLAERLDDAWRIVVLDAPRHRLVGLGPPTDALAAADWRRLSRSIDAALPRRTARRTG